MAKLDVYLRSVERFGATGAVLNSGQAVTLRFPTGDRHATQVTPHDQLVALVREVAPPNALEQIDKNRPARFEIESGEIRYSIAVSPKPGAWQVVIEQVSRAASSFVPPATPVARGQRPPTAAVAEPSDLTIERGQYDGPIAIQTTSGSVFLDQLTAAGRSAGASDIYLGAGIAAFQRAAGELMQTASGTLDADGLARELGIVAPAEARGAWGETRAAVFTYGDGVGRVRVTLSRDHRGPTAALRLLPDAGFELDRLGLPSEVGDWLLDRGLIAIAGPSGCGKTTTLATLVDAIAERQRRVIAIEDPIELLHRSPWVSQRAIGEHVPSIAEGVAAAMREAADVIVIGSVTTRDAAAALIEAVLGGHLVLTTLVAPVASGGVERLIDRLPAEQQPLARAILQDALLGTIGPIVTPNGGRAFDVTGRPAA